MLYLKVAAVITLIISLVLSPSAKHPEGRKDLVGVNTRSEPTLTVQAAPAQCKAILDGGVQCVEKATHKGFCTQHFKE
ncbi:MAG: hypothetical protein JNK79_06460 [Chitinophagaceae bacterium]|nr:hypothetical protein [Chitinophagaceae bacterium]